MVDGLVSIDDLTAAAEEVDGAFSFFKKKREEHPPYSFSTEVSIEATKVRICIARYREVSSQYDKKMPTRDLPTSTIKILSKLNGIVNAAESSVSEMYPSFKEICEAAERDS